MATSLVLLHGFTHTSASWNRVLKELNAERYRPFAPDLRGHGSASAVEPVDLEGVLRDVSELVDDRFVLVGYSMGGRIALHAALAMPDRVQQLVLIGASPGLASAAERDRRRRADEALADRVERMSIQAFASEWARTPVLAGLPEEILAEAHADRLRSSVAGLARALRGLGTGALSPAWDRLGELRMPVTLIVGESDQRFRALAAQMAERVPDARIEMVPGAGHAVHLEAPEKIAELLDGASAAGPG